MSAAMNPDDRLYQLLGSHVTEGLTAEERHELDQLEQELGLSDEKQKFELTASALDLAMTKNVDVELPDELRDKLLLKAGEFFGNPDTSEQSPQRPDWAGDIPLPNRLPNRSTNVEKKGSGLREALAWFVALAATGAFCLLYFGNGIENRVPSVSQKTAEEILAEKFAEVDASRDISSTDWLDVENKVVPEDVKGRVVWSGAIQKGYMIFNNLPINDPKVEQYQLWIFDTDTAQEVPVDGGVFDVTNAEEMKVAFKAAHTVNQAVQFAVTIEEPGGVQRSDRSRLPIVAVVAQEKP